MSRLRLRIPSALAGLREALAAEGVEEEGDGAGGLVFAADPGAPADFAAVEEELVECFHLSREAMASGAPVVYVLSQPDLLGQRGALGAMRAGALLSGARTLAIEGARAGLRANAVAVGDDLDAAAVARWVRRLLADPGVSGELVRVGAAHVGKVLP